MRTGIYEIHCVDPKQACEHANIEVGTIEALRRRKQAWRHIVSTAVSPRILVPVITSRQFC